MIENRIEFIRSSRESGKLYGYPKCCTDFFINVSLGCVKRKYAKVSFSVSNKSGFFPCYKHALMIIEKKITLESLIKDRDKSLMPFPFDWTYK